MRLFAFSFSAPAFFCAVGAIAACSPDEAQTLPPGTPLTPPPAHPSPDPPPAIPPNVEDAGHADAAPDASAPPTTNDGDAAGLGF